MQATLNYLLVETYTKNSMKKCLEGVYLATNVSTSVYLLHDTAVWLKC